MKIPPCPTCARSRRVANQRGHSGALIAGHWHCNACDVDFAAGPTVLRPAGPGRSARGGPRVADPEARQLLLTALRHLEASVGQGGRLRRYLDGDEPRTGAWADLARVVGDVSKGSLSDAWCGRRPRQDALNAVRSWLAKESVSRTLT